MTDDKKGIEEYKRELEELGHIMVLSGEEDEVLDAIWPGHKHLGSIEELLGYEPENYKLLGALEHNGTIITFADAGNTWLVYGPLDGSRDGDVEFAKEIKEGYKRLHDKQIVD